VVAGVGPVINTAKVPLGATVAVSGLGGVGNETSSSRADTMSFGGVKGSGHGHEGRSSAIREVTEERLITLDP
jgi:hypothetical protein